jgi:hypothetical protein
LSLLCLPILAAIPAVICGHIAVSRIRRSAGALDGTGLAVAGLVTGYIGLVMPIIMLPMMLTIAVPNFIKARQQAQAAVCRQQVMRIESAKQVWGLEKQKTQQTRPTEEDLLPYLKGGMPVCPTGGQYTLGSLEEPPACSMPEHARPEN